MLRTFRSGPWLFATAFIVASCSQGGSPGLTSPGAAANPAPAGAGTAGLLADGDVKTGPGPLAIESVRMDRQTPQGASIVRQYANPGQTYRTEAGETIELWMEWVRGGNNAPVNPRFLVDWGEGENERFDFTGCGSCLLKHTYPRPGRFTVKATLDDRAGTTVTRTFYLESTVANACGAPASTDVFLGDDGEGDSGDSSDFDNAETPPIGPVENASTVRFTCLEDQSDLLRSSSEGVRSHGESSSSCYAHSHGNTLNLFVEVHDPGNDSWTRVFTQAMGEDDVYVFNGLVVTFSPQNVDRVRVLSNPGQGNTYHGWGGASLTVSCQ